MQHIPEKEAIVDKGAKFEPKPDTPLGGFIPPVENLSVDIESDASAWQVEASWNTPYSSRGVDFLLKLTIGDRIVGTASTTDTMYRFGGLLQGNYVLSVVPQNDRKQKGEVATTSFAINPPLPPSYIEVESGYFSLGIIPRSGGQNSLRAQYEFWFSEKQITDIRDVENRTEYLGVSSMWVIQGRNLKAGHTYYIYVRSINAVGRSEFVEGIGQPESYTREILDNLDKELQETQAWKTLSETVDWNENTVKRLRYNEYRLSRKFEKYDEQIEIDIKDIRTQIENTKADIIIQKEAISSITQAQSTYQQQVQAKFNQQSGIVNQKMNTQFTQSGGYARHSMNITIIQDNIKYNAGGLVVSAEIKNKKITSYIGFNANNFAFYNPKNNRMELFMSAKNGQFFIRDALIDKAMIRKLVLSEAITSDNYYPDESGFIIDVKNNKLEFYGGNGGTSLTEQNLYVKDEFGNNVVIIGDISNEE